MPTERGPQSYGLSEGVRVFRSGDEIRFRKGIWSYNEATVRLAGQGEKVVRFFNALYERLAKGYEADPDEIGREVGAGVEELASYRELLDNLKSQQYLRDSGQRTASRAVSALLGGNLGGLGDHVGTPSPVLFFTDSDYARGAAKALAGEIGLPLDILDSETQEALMTADMTTRVDAVQHTESVARLEKVFHPYSCALGCVASPSMSMLRNINRLLIRAEKPLILGILDGPFMSALATLAPQTGCFECYEQRMLARLEDTIIYQRFVEATAGSPAASGPWHSPHMHMLVAAVVSEGYLYSTLGILRLAGRIVNTYLPLLEIQVQDLLRTPYCPACGFISRAQMNEMYTSSRRVVSEMLAKIEVEG